MSANPIRFDGDVAIVTGAGGGIGRALARELARRGARVLVNDYGGDTFGHGGAPERAEQVAAEIRAGGGNAVANATAVGTPEAARAIVAAAVEAFGRVDILVNNAGITLPGLITDSSDAELERHLRVGLLGAFALVRAVWPLMKAQNHGRILSTTSSAALGVGANAPYATAKAGLIGLTLDAAIEGAPHGICVNAMMPAAYSRMIDQIPDPAYVEWFRSNLPADRVGAGAAYFLSRQSDVTGRVLVIGGGRVARLAFVENRGFFDRELTAEQVSDQWALIDNMKDAAVVGSTAEAMQIYMDVFGAPHAGSLTLDLDTVVGASDKVRHRSADL